MFQVKIVIERAATSANQVEALLMNTNNFCFHELSDAFLIITQSI